MEKNILYIAKIPYETGEIHYRYSRKISDDGTRWISDGLFTEYYQNGNIASTGLYDNGLENGFNCHEPNNGKPITDLPLFFIQKLTDKP